MMYTIGIVDITTVGSTICQRRISELGGISGNHPPFAVHSIPFKLYRDPVIHADWESMAALVTQSIEELTRLDVDFIIIPSNTPHYAYDTYAKLASVPVLNLIAISADACEQAKLKKIAILGTKATMTGGLYQDKLEKRGLSLIVPEAHICDAVHTFIMEEIVPGKVSETSRKTVLELIQSMDCDGYILGCTELPEVYHATEIGKPAIDTTRLLAEVAFDIAMREDEALMLSYSVNAAEVKS